MTEARPLRVGVAELLRHPGQRTPVRRQLPLDGLAISTAAVPDGADLDVDLVLEATGGGVVAAGTVRAPWVGACRRCLEPVEGVLVVDVREIYERHPTEGETYPLRDDEVDLEPLVRENVVLSLPLAPLCAEDCRGPAPETFPATAADHGPDPDPAGHDQPAEPGRDPRWAALDELRFDD